VTGLKNGFVWVKAYLASCSLLFSLK